jgi:hypothetical protein
VPDETPNMRVHMLERICEVMCEPKVLYGAEIWGIESDWDIVEGVQGKFCKKLLRIFRNAFYLIVNNDLFIGA